MVKNAWGLVDTFFDEYKLVDHHIKSYNDFVDHRIQDIIDIALLQGISVIFTNAETDGTQAEAFAEEISGSKVTLAPLSYDYISNYRAMAQAIADAL
jgi:DNA-directed RNA polymerase beta subunit